MTDRIAFHNKVIYPIIMPSDYGGMGSINCYIYQQGDDLTLIDAGIGTEEFAQFFWEKLAEYGIDAAHINRIVLTHFHSDHIGMVNTLVERYRMPVYASKMAIPRLKCEDAYLQQKLTFYGDVYKQYGVTDLAAGRMARLEKTLQNKEHLMLNMEILPLVEGETIANLQVIAAPGHSPDSICLYDAETGWLLAGDFLLANGVTSALVDHDEEGKLVSSIGQYVNSIHKLQPYPIQTVFAGHGALFDNAHEVMENSLKKFDYKLQKLLAKIEDGCNTASSIGEAMYGPRFAKLFVFFISDIIGLTLLAEERGFIVREWLNDEWHFSYNIKS